MGMKNYKCSYKGKSRLVYNVKDRNEAAALSWIELGAPDAFCVDTEEFASLPAINLDPGDEDDTDADKTLETLLTGAGISW